MNMMYLSMGMLRNFSYSLSKSMWYHYAHDEWWCCRGSTFNRTTSPSQRVFMYMLWRIWLVNWKVTDCCSRSFLTLLLYREYLETEETVINYFYKTHRKFILNQLFVCSIILASACLYWQVLLYTSILAVWMLKLRSRWFLRQCADFNAWHFLSVCSNLFLKILKPLSLCHSWGQFNKYTHFTHGDYSTYRVSHNTLYSLLLAIFQISKQLE